MRGSNPVGLEGGEVDSETITGTWTWETGSIFFRGGNTPLSRVDLPRKENYEVHQYFEGPHQLDSVWIYSLRINASVDGCVGDHPDASIVPGVLGNHHILRYRVGVDGRKNSAE